VTDRPGLIERAFQAAKSDKVGSRKLLAPARNGVRAATLLSDTAELLSAAWDDLHRFADRHVRVAAMVLSLIVTAASVIYLVPVMLALAAPPVGPELLEPRGPVAFLFLDIDGKVIGRRGPVAGRPLHLTEMPPYLPAAFIAMEDRRFYDHHGVDFFGLARAAYANLRAGRVVAGGSTISQQTAKLLFARRERTFSRKLGELANTAALENSLGKQRILEIYLNRLYLGDGAYGVDTAARTYFGVSARQVSLPQAAMLAALTRAPSVFSPRRDLAMAQQRAARVLQAMAETGAITAPQASFAIAHPAVLMPRLTDTHTYFLDAAADEARQLAADSGARELVVQTTLDSRLQQRAEAIATDAFNRSGRKLGFGQVAMVVMKPDGAVAAMVGGVDYGQSVFNRVIQAHRQPGSAFKPFVYLAALQAGITPWDWREDQPVDIAGYQPANYRDAHYGRLQLTDALARSVNTITVNLAQEVGMPKVAAAARQAGITSPLQDNASLALGTNEVTPLELAAAYGFFANGGHVVKPVLVTRIEAAATGTVLYQRPSDSSPAALSDQVRRDMTAMLFNVVTSGTGTAARLAGREAAGKTGTTQDYRDAWFAGFTTDYVAAVWIGNDDNHPMRRVTGGSMPALMWKELMTAAEGDAPPKPLDRTPPPAMVKDSFQNQSLSYVDDIEAAPPSLPGDDRGGYNTPRAAASAGYIARQEVYAPPQRTEPPSPAAPALPSRAADLPKPPPSDAYDRSLQNGRPVPNQTYLQGRDPYYARQPDGDRSAQDGRPVPYQPNLRGRDPYYARQQPDWDRSSQEGRPLPYRPYLRGRDSYYARQPDGDRSSQDERSVLGQPYLRRQDPYYVPNQPDDDRSTYSYSRPAFGAREGGDDGFFAGR
jgi:penicillin-binding protein 1A